jgi:hypothetical protein
MISASNATLIQGILQTRNDAPIRRPRCRTSPAGFPSAIGATIEAQPAYEHVDVGWRGPAADRAIPSRPRRRTTSAVRAEAQARHAFVRIPKLKPNGAAYQHDHPSAAHPPARPPAGHAHRTGPPTRARPQPLAPRPAARRGTSARGPPGHLRPRPAQASPSAWSAPPPTACTYASTRPVARLAPRPVACPLPPPAAAAGRLGGGGRAPAGGGLMTGGGGSTRWRGRPGPGREPDRSSSRTTGGPRNDRRAGSTRVAGSRGCSAG